MKYQAIIIGAGLSGAVMAERMASQLGWKVLVLEQRDHIGGNCFDEYDEHGVLIHRYGPHLFHTDSKDVWDYLSQFTEWLPYEHRVLSRIDGQLVPIPFNLTSIERCFPANKAGAMIEALRTRFGDGARVPILDLRKEAHPLLGELADFIYQKAFVNYTSKQWGVPPEQISAEVTARVPVVVSRDDRYFTDPWQAVPAAGYTAMFERMLAHPLIEVRLSTPMAQHVSLDWQQKQMLLDGVQFDGPLIYTGMLDQLMPAEGNCLPYRSLRFEHCHLAQEQFQPVTTVNYPNEEAFTRITEFKHFSGQVHPGTSIVYEYPCDYQPEQGLEPYYPLFTDSAKQHYQVCRDELAKFPGLTALGRLAEYRYFDMDDAVSNALNIFGTSIEKIPSKPLVSVIMSVHNCAYYIEDALDSILKQTYQNLEVIIFDDGSTDETGIVIGRIAAKDSRIIHYHRRQQGIANCLNEALLLARGEFIARMDGDDISLPERIEKQMVFLREHPQVDLVGCWLKLFGERDEIWHYRDCDNFIKNTFLLFSNGVGHNAILVRADVYKHFRYDPEYTDVEDTELWTRMAISQPEVRFANLREVLVLYRIHGTQSSILRKVRQRELYRLIVSKYLDSLGVSVTEQDMEAHEWLVDQPTNMSEVQLYRLANWLNLIAEHKHKVLPDEHGVLAERWHHLCRKNRVRPDIYARYQAEFDMCWLPPMFV